MRVVKEGIKEAPQIAEPGDIVEWQGGTMEIVMAIKKNLNGSTEGVGTIGFNGKSGNFDIQSQIDKGFAKLYKASEYELVLRRKEGK